MVMEFATCISLENADNFEALIYLYPIICESFGHGQATNNTRSAPDKHLISVTQLGHRSVNTTAMQRPENEERSQKRTRLFVRCIECDAPVWHCGLGYGRDYRVLDPKYQPPIGPCHFIKAFCLYHAFESNYLDEYLLDPNG